MSVAIYNTTIGRMVDVPEESVAAYLADPRYLPDAPSDAPEPAAVPAEPAADTPPAETP